MHRMSIDQHNQNQNTQEDGSWWGLIASVGVVLRGLASEFNPITAVLAFLIVAVAGSIGLAGLDTIPKWIRFAVVLAGAAGFGYITGKLTHVVLIGLAALIGGGLIAAIGWGLWMLL